ncbi:hypothetical protein PVK06_028894 [Gossypium arboreum]|uniref:Protein kinase domain-containing protein n=1 Tax=Gossypium arboreum TaxID=29729 RepID=A0ABR0P544_GOSAR|nr:hypothetical protein PVK06_028894 [Gossypium arboreum]
MPKKKLNVNFSIDMFWCRDDAGRLVRTERLRTKDITHRVKMKNYWQGGVCLAFADEVLCWLYRTVKEILTTMGVVMVLKLAESGYWIMHQSSLIIWQRVSEAQDITTKLGGQVIGHTWLLESIAACVNFIDSNVGNKSSSERVLKDKGYDGTSSDIWSCGVILFVLMAGYLPFDKPSLIGLYKKIWEASFSCPSWFSSGARNLIKRILDPNPITHITILEILQDEWFKKGYKPPKFEQDEDVNLDDNILYFTWNIFQVNPIISSNPNAIMIVAFTKKDLGHPKHVERSMKIVVSHVAPEKCCPKYLLLEFLTELGTDSEVMDAQIIVFRLAMN